MRALQLSPISRRLLPLYIAAFLQGIPLWYAIEKLFMVSIGFDTASIGLMVAIMSAVMLIVETPSGILADRWSRKGVMALGCVALLLSAIVGAVSFNEPVYIISCILWGVYGALYSGTYDAVIYDATVEEHGDSKKFEYYLGRLKAVEGAAFIVGALGGGFIAATLDMRTAYILSIPLLGIALFFLWKFKEPKLHKMELSEQVFKHIRQTFAAVLRRPILLPVIVAIVGFGVLQETIFELSQLWFIAVSAPIALYGLFSAVVFSSWTAGGLLAAKMQSRRATITLMTLVIVAIFGLIVTRNFWIILASQFIMALSLVALSVILTKKMHDELPSRLRAGSASVVGTLARAILIPGSLVFTVIANTTTVFAATYLLLGVAVVAVIAFLCIAPTKNSAA